MKDRLARLLNPPNIPEMVDEMLDEALRLAKGDAEQAAEIMKWLCTRDPMIALAMGIWHIDRLKSEAPAAETTEASEDLQVKVVNVGQG